MATKIKAVAYLRTSSAANVGEDKDSHKRQLATISAYAKRAGYVIELPPYYDAAVSGADPIEGRPGFAALMAYLAAHPECRTILVEDASRFARGVVLQEVGYQMLKGLSITLIPVDAPEHFQKDADPMTDAIRQMVGVMNELVKKQLVLKLRVARDRKRSSGLKVEGRKSHAERSPGAVALARKLYRKNPRSGNRRTYREIAALLAEQKHLAASNKPFGPSAIKSMLGA